MAKIRADAHRNRERLLETATAAFTAADGTTVSLEAIARDAGVGIGTLYRHFPNREALVEAVYRTELAEVAASAGQLLERHPPVVALRRWMDRYAASSRRNGEWPSRCARCSPQGPSSPVTPGRASSAPSTPS